MADLLQLAPVTVRNLRAEPDFTPERACQTVCTVTEWEDFDLKTWETLVEIYIQSMDRNTLAKDIILALTFWCVCQYVHMQYIPLRWISSLW